MVAVCGCAALADLAGRAGDPTTPEGQVVGIASGWLPWLPWAVAGLNALLGVWQALRARRARLGAVAIAQAVETAEAAHVKELVASSTRDTSLGAWIHALVKKFVQPQ